MGEKWQCMPCTLHTSSDPTCVPLNMHSVQWKLSVIVTCNLHAASIKQPASPTRTNTLQSTSMMQRSCCTGKLWLGLRMLDRFHCTTWWIYTSYKAMWGNWQMSTLVNSNFWTGPNYQHWTKGHVGQFLEICCIVESTFIKEVIELNHPLISDLASNICV